MTSGILKRTFLHAAVASAVLTLAFADPAVAGLGVSERYAENPPSYSFPLAINTGATALQIAQAMFTDPTLVTGAAFVAKPPVGTPDAVADSGSALAGFPTNGNTYGMLTTGDANLAATSNCCSNSGADDGGPNVRGNTDYDVTILRIDFNVPSGNCVSVGKFRFLSEEFPEYVGTSYNDAFIAELDVSTWTTSGSAISAPDNFAFDPAGSPISINAAGTTSMTAAEAAGTTYDGATPLLLAKTPVSPGPHSLYFSIFDQGDRIFDSAVFIDGIELQSVAPGQCTTGAQPVPAVQYASCEAIPFIVEERDHTGLVGDFATNLSPSRTDTPTKPGPTLPAPTGLSTLPSPTDVHQSNHGVAFTYNHPTQPISVSTATVHSRCDVSAHVDPNNVVTGHAYGRAGIEDLTVKVGTTTLRLDLVDYEANAYSVSNVVSMREGCDFVQADLSTLSPPPTTVESCARPNTVAPLGVVTVTLNEARPPFYNAGYGQWTYMGSAVHVHIAIPGVTDTDIWLGYVKVAVPGASATVAPTAAWVAPGPCSAACVVV